MLWTTTNLALTVGNDVCTNLALVHTWNHRCLEVGEELKPNWFKTTSKRGGGRIQQWRSARHLVAHASTTWNRVLFVSVALDLCVLFIYDKRDFLGSNHGLTLNTPPTLAMSA